MKKKIDSLAFASNSNHLANTSNISNHEMPSFHHATLGYWLPRTVSKVVTDFFDETTNANLTQSI